MQKFSSFGRKNKNRPKFDIEWLCSKVFNCCISFVFIAHFGKVFTPEKLQGCSFDRNAGKMSSYSHTKCNCNLALL